jgi:son of sevenless-like protein
VSDVICKEKNLKLRTDKFKRFVKLANECAKLNNFNAVFEITGGLQNSAVHRLKKTQEVMAQMTMVYVLKGLPVEIKKMYEELLVLTAPGKSWKYYRDTLHTINPPCIPFLGVYQTDLTFISEGNQVKVSIPQSNIVTFYR